MVVGIIYNLILNLGILWTSPLFMRLVTACSIPASFIVDIAIFQIPINWIRMGGSSFIVAGFIFFTLFGNQDLKNLGRPEEKLDQGSDEETLLVQKNGART